MKLIKRLGPCPALAVLMFALGSADALTATHNGLPSETPPGFKVRTAGKLGVDPPTASRSERYDEYVSDPAKPVPYRLQPTLDAEAPDSTWGEWLVDDQRFAARRIGISNRAADCAAARGRNASSIDFPVMEAGAQ